MNRLLLCICTSCILGGFTTATPVLPLQQQPAEITQIPEELLARAVQAIGGRKALNKLESFQLHGVMRLPDERPIVEVELATRKGGKVLGIMTYIGIGQSRFGSDGTTAWEQKLNSENDISWSILDSASLSQKVQQMNWLEWFTMLPTQLHTMNVIGSEEFDGEDCWTIQIASENKEQLAFFSKKTYRPRGRRTVEKTASGDATIDVYFRDWERVGNLLLFHTVIYSRDGTEITMKLDRIVLNKANDGLFILPHQIVQLRDQQDAVD